MRSMVKLFGKTIQLNSNDDVLDPVRGADSDQNISCSNGSASSLDEKTNAAMDSSGGNPETPVKEKEESESSISEEEKPSKKPDKILPCPRCKSNETKFCYFNNYNLKQPRHFCKNCQRYWTAGGAVRNVPVGSGRRKAKNPLVQSSPIADNAASSHFGVVTNETEQLAKKSNNFHGFGPCYPAPPWYPAQWGPIYTTTPLWGYGVHDTCPLGKHSREEEDMEGVNGTKTSRVLVPKTLRIDDPNEAAKSSIWATLGIRNEKGNSIGSSGVFGGFQMKIREMNSVVVDGSLVLQANPAAFSRSLRFHESAE